MENNYRSCFISKKEINMLVIHFFIVIFIFLLGSCNYKSLSNEEAKTLILQSLPLPKQFTKKLDDGDAAQGGPRIQQLQYEGYLNVTAKEYLGVTRVHIDATEKSKPYLINVDKNEEYHLTKLTFKTYDIDFGEITGISLNKEQDEATVRFTLKATNVTPVGAILLPQTKNPYNAEFVFKKFDSGWQLKSGQNEDPEERLKKIIEN